MLNAPRTNGTEIRTTVGTVNFALTVGGGPEDTGGTEPKQNIFTGLPTDMSGILGIMERHPVHYCAIQNKRKKHCDYDKTY